MQIVRSSRAETGDRPRILVVEPKRAYLALLVRRLVEAGYRVTAAESGSAAIAALHRLPVDMILAELKMPRVGGAELARAIRGEVQWNDIPVMLIAGKSKPADAVRAYEAGADDVIAKPFHFEVLLRGSTAGSLVPLLKGLLLDNAMLDARVVERAIADRRAQARLLANNPTPAAGYAGRPTAVAINSRIFGRRRRARAPAPDWRSRSPPRSPQS